MVYDDELLEGPSVGTSIPTRNVGLPPVAPGGLPRSATGPFQIEVNSINRRSPKEVIHVCPRSEVLRRLL